MPNSNNDLFQQYAAHLPLAAQAYALACWKGTQDTVSFNGLIPSELAAISAAVNDIKTLNS